MLAARKFEYKEGKNSLLAAAARCRDYLNASNNF
jgi:hypothetical protein